MKARDIFGIIIRTLGVFLLLYGLWYQAYAIAEACGLLQDSPGEMAAYFTPAGIPAVLIAVVFLRCARQIVRSHIQETEMIQTQRPNHALQRTRPSRSGCNPRVPWAGSLSLGR